MPPRLRDVAADSRAVRKRLTAPDWRRGIRLAVLLFAVVTAGGTIGYMVIEGWSAWDAFYMTIISVTTAGYREVHPMSVAGQAWTSLVLICGVSTLFYTASQVMAEVVEGGFLQRVESRRFKRMLDQLNNHFIICGYGRIGSVIADEFRRQQVPYVVIDRDADRVHDVIAGGGIAVAADASRDHALHSVGIGRARGLIAAVGSEAENVYAVLTARVLNPSLYIIARSESPDAESKLLRAGANRVLSPYQLGGVQMAATALRPAVVDFMRLAIGSDSLELSAEQIEVAPGTPLVGRTIKDANLRQDFGVIVVAIKRSAGHMEFNPAPEAVIAAGDELIVLGHSDQLKALETAAGGGGEPRVAAGSPRP
jgi:voltage-gated potassium channel